MDKTVEVSQAARDAGGITFAMCGEPSPPCDHDFQGWRNFEDGRGGETVCAKCGLGAMAYTLSLDF
jgi:hypothetical protein